jgi:hypothetical protein
LRAIEANSGKQGRLNHDELVAYFSQKSNWSFVAEEFAKAIKPLLPERFSIPMCGFGKRMEKEMQDPSNREKFARRRYESGLPKPSYMPQDEALDAVYSSLARQIEVKVSTPRKAMSMPLVPYQYAPFNPSEHGLNEIEFRKPLIVPEKETPFGVEGLTFGVAEHHINMPLLVKKSVTGFPQFKCAYLDCSSSMQEGLPDKEGKGSTAFIPWGDKSKYHYLCKAWYGIIEYLARQQILPNVNVTLGSFSSTSKVRHGLEEAKKLLFNPEWGMTNIDPSALEELLQGEANVFFTVSDGEVQNWKQVSMDFRQKAKNHHYFHIQLGPHTAMSNSLRKAGLPVYQITKGEGLDRLAIDLTAQIYQHYIVEQVEHLK